MGYKWRPSKTARKEFAIRMQDPAEKQAYEMRKKQKSDKRRQSSAYDYNSAGGYYKPTKIQYDSAMSFLTCRVITPAEEDACNKLISAYCGGDKIHHDIIHVVNELIRKTNAR